MKRLLCVMLFLAACFPLQAKKKAWVPPVVSYILNTNNIQIEKPLNLSVNRQGTTNHISWESSETATFKILQSVDGASFTEITETNATSAVIAAPLDHRYQYRVAACVMINGKSRCSDWTGSSDIVGELPPPQGITFAATPSGADITLQNSHQDFSPISYKLEQQFNGGQWQALSVETEKHYSFSPLLTGSYKVRAFLCVNEPTTLCSVNSVETESFDVVVVPGAPTLGVNHGQYNVIRLFWQPVTNAVAYRIQAFTTHNGLERHYDGYTSGTEFVFNDNLPRGNLVTFFINACAEPGGRCGVASNQVATTPLLWGPPQAPVVSIDETGTDPHRVYLKWNTVPQATQFTWRVTDYGTQVYNGEVSSGNTTSLVKSLLDASCPMFQVMACNAENQCSFYSQEVYLLDESCVVRPPPNPITLTSSDSSPMQGQQIELRWTMSETFTRPVYYQLFKTVGTGQSELIKDNIQSTSANVELTDFGSVTYTVKACELANGCRDSGKSIQLQVSKATIIQFSPLPGEIGTPLSLRWDVPAGIECSSDDSVFDRTVVGTSQTNLTFDQTYDLNIVWTCSGSNTPDYQVQSRLLVKAESDFNINFSSTNVVVGQPVTLQWNLSSGTRCRSDVLNKTLGSDILAQQGEEDVIFYAPINGKLAWSCSDTVGDFVYESTMTVGKLAPPANLSNH